MDEEKLVKNIVLFFGLVVTFLITALAIAITPNWYEGLAIGLGLCFLFGGIIFLGLRSHRLRKKIPKIESASHFHGDAVLEFSITESPYSLDTSYSRIFFYSGIGVLLFSGLIFFQLEPDSIRIEMLIKWSAGFYIVILFIAWTVSEPYKKAGRLLERNRLPRKLVFNKEGISIPIEIVTQNAFHLAVRAQRTDIFIAWKDITSWEIYAGSGKSMDQHSLNLQGDSRRITGFFSKVGILRTKEIRKSDHTIINFASKFLSNEIKICTDDLG